MQEGLTLMPTNDEDDFQVFIKLLRKIQITALIFMFAIIIVIAFLIRSNSLPNLPQNADSVLTKQTK